MSPYIWPFGKSSNEVCKIPLQKNEINRTKEINYSDNKNPKFDELHQKIKFYQNENVRLSSELSKSQKMTIVANENLSNIENTKNIIFNQIQELQRSLGENNVVNSKFIKENYDYIEPDIKENTDVNLNVLVSEIFDKKWLIQLKIKIKLLF